MLRPTIRRVTVVVLLVSIVAGGALWFVIGYGILKVSRHVATEVDQLPHGPRPQPAKLK